MRKKRLLGLPNDLYVMPDYRKFGIAELLLDTVHRFAKDDGADRVALKTEKNNTIAKHLYQNLHYKLEHVFDHYTLYLK